MHSEKKDTQSISKVGKKQSSPQNCFYTSIACSDPLTDLAVILLFGLIQINYYCTESEKAEFFFSGTRMP